MDLFSVVGLIGLLGAGVCMAAYAYGNIVKRAAFRWLSILSLFSTIIALAQMSHLMKVGVPPGGSSEAAFAVSFLLVAGLAQSLMAIRSRRASDGARPDYNGRQA